MAEGNDLDTKLLWIPLLPFLGFLINGLLGRRLGHRAVSITACLLPILSFVISYAAWGRLVDGASALHWNGFPWIWLEGVIEVPFALHFDGLSAVMCLVITGVGSLIHLYSIGYMKGDPGYHRYFAYMNLFTAFMLLLVLADNLLLMFIGWEGVGLCSYLLIGFWYEEDANCAAGKKAFIVNRIGDLAFLIGMFLCLQHFGSLDMSVITATEAITRVSAESLTFPWGAAGVITTIAVLLFIGATGKSAQIPLFVWLPDAMAGPTPVSALIHAATMVTSGVYLCCRLMPLFEASPQAMGLIAAVGACTALLAAVIAFSQNDIKKVLAYSTVSQLGYMFFAVGMGAFSAALFHLVTHAFFKALLFLGSGSVIHAMHHEQDMRKMGGLKTRLPFTHVTFLIGTLAIAGVPPLAGFFSKDEILFAGFQQGFLNGVGSAQLFWLISFLTAGMTAFYMVRCVSMTFWGESRVDESLEKKIHEPGGWIGFALFVLAIASALGGFLNVPEFLGGQASLGHFTGLHHGHSGLSTDQVRSLHVSEWQSMLLSLLIAGAGLALAIHCYGKGRDLRTSFIESSAGQVLVRLSARKFYVDEIYLHTIVRPFETLSHLLFILFDRILIDGILVNGLALLTRGIGDIFRRMQTGYIPGYLLTFGCGALVLIYILLNFLREGGAQ
ncbi:MAG: NADH-quinone oxidoreductase subunit L [Planctomycetes bacterium]|nr:NADH-quinone oxidoreductase subunit L [Planctomycetota bacterium]